MIKAMVHSLNALAEVEILVQQSNNNILARYRGDVCTAIYNPFTGLYYVDDVYRNLDKKRNGGGISPRPMIEKKTTGEYKMYIETRYNNSGKVEAKLHKGFSYPQLENNNTFDRYVESIGKSEVQTDHDNSSDYENLSDWVENLVINLDDIVQLIIDLDSGEWVNISAYC